MEPLSAFYSSPLVVLDFQSLYPSVMIAYNYCYSTCLGRVRKFKDTYKLGVTELNLPPGLLGELQDHIQGTSFLVLVYVYTDIYSGS
jgi:DNA polymerase zeta